MMKEIITSSHLLFQDRPRFLGKIVQTLIPHKTEAPPDLNLEAAPRHEGMVLREQNVRLNLGLVGL
jgi:hypothetical protein